MQKAYFCESQLCVKDMREMSYDTEVKERGVVQH